LSDSAKRLTLTYVYDCPKCEHHFEVIKSHKDMERTEWCPKCEEPSVRAFMPERVYFSGQKVSHAEFNPGLGCVVKNEFHKKELLKQKGLVEVGNDYGSGDKMSDSFDKARAEKLRKRIEDAV
jgi:putative FmdB family regulatory protein